MKEPKWTLTKVEQRDGSARWSLWNAETETNHEGAQARRIAASLKARGFEVGRKFRFAYSASEVGLAY